MKIISIQNEDKSICAPCGGHCCKWSPGRFIPDQLISSNSKAKQELQALLDTGKHVFVRIDKVWIMQPKTNMTTPFDQDGLGKCVNLTADGCSMSFSDRPLECQKLVPKANDKCSYPSDWNAETDIVNPWKPYQSIIEKMYDEYWDKVPVVKFN